MVQSAADDKTGTVPPKPLPRKIIAMGSIKLTDSDFIALREQHCPSLVARDAMLMYMRYLNGEDKIRFEQEMKLWREQYRAKLPPHQRYHVEYLTANRDELEVAVSEQEALNEILCQDVVLTPLNDSQNIPPPLEQSPPQIDSAPPPTEQPPLLNIPHLAVNRRLTRL
jgi:hypothetical protein